MSKFDSWVLDQQEKEQEQLAERLKKKENLKTFKVTERYIKQDTWIVNAVNEQEAIDIFNPVLNTYRAYLSNNKIKQIGQHHRTKNKLYSHGKENAILFYGNETELQAYRDQSRYDIVEKFNECFNYDGFENILCKHDGSLDTDKGFEMSSTNCSFEYHKETFWNDFFELNPAQYCKGYDGYQCGIHWHFNRNVFTENQLRRLNCFYNHPKNKNLIVDIAGREGYQYCKFVPSITFDDPIRTIGDDFKYRVINFSNEHTIEIRIFRSNLKKISFFRYLEFVHSVNEWIRSSDQDNAENITWEYYFDWLLKNISRKFENLFFFLDDREHFDHLENIEEWKYVYTNFKTLITDFRNNNQEQIELESEEI